MANRTKRFANMKKKTKRKETEDLNSIALISKRISKSAQRINSNCNELYIIQSSWPFGQRSSSRSPRQARQQRNGQAKKKRNNRKANTKKGNKKTKKIRWVQITQQLKRNSNFCSFFHSFFTLNAASAIFLFFFPFFYFSIFIAWHAPFTVRKTIIDKDLSFSF